MSILMQRLVKVDGKVRTDSTYPAGFMDVIDIEKTDEHFRLIYDSKGRFVTHRITKARPCPTPPVPHACSLHDGSPSCTAAGICTTYMPAREGADNVHAALLSHWFSSNMRAAGWSGGSRVAAGGGSWRWAKGAEG
jgi:hypothetical protein